MIHIEPLTPPHRPSTMRPICGPRRNHPPILNPGSHHNARITPEPRKLRRTDRRPRPIRRDIRAIQQLRAIDVPDPRNHRLIHHKRPDHRRAPRNARKRLGWPRLGAQRIRPEPRKNALAPITIENLARRRPAKRQPRRITSQAQPHRTRYGRNLATPAAKPPE